MLPGFSVNYWSCVPLCSCRSSLILSRFVCGDHFMNFYHDVKNYEVGKFWCTFSNCGGSIYIVVGPPRYKVYGERCVRFTVNSTQVVLSTTTQVELNSSWPNSGLFQLANTQVWMRTLIATQAMTQTRGSWGITQR